MLKLMVISNIYGAQPERSYQLDSPYLRGAFYPDKSYISMLNCRRQHHRLA